MALSPGTRLGAYEVRAQLGAGGMGAVYRAHDPRLGRDVALKVLHPEVARDANRLERFTREARAVAALNHPHIVTIYSTEEADGVPFMTMELVEGQALDELIPREGLALTRFFELALPLADALAAAHQKQITHRDLKPANVMVAADGRLKVLDFGLARVASAAPDQTIDATRAVLTVEGTIVGTMPYMSPEQVEGRAIDARSDLFSLGVMFYEMLAGTRPFKGPSSPALMSAILRDDPEPLASSRSDVPEPLVRLVSRCLEKRPEERVQTARDVFNELRHAQKQAESGPGRRSGSGAAAAAPEASLWIAVLPFGTRSADADSEALAAGLTEDITSGLSRFPALSVLARESAQAYRNTTLSVQQIAERLGARYVLGGTVRRSAAAVRIATHLVDAKSGAHLWTETYDQPLEGTDLFAIQDDVTDRIVATIADKAGVLARSMVQTVRQLPLEQLSARELILRCWMFQWQPTPDDHATTRTALEHYLAQHPLDPHVWAELANFYICEHSLFFNPLPDALGRAMRAARRAVELDPGNQEGWEMVALASFYRKDEPAMMEACDRTVRLNPRNSNALAWMGSIRSHAGDYDAALVLSGRARTLNQAHPGWYHFTPFNCAIARGDYAEALRAARRVNMPEFMWMHFAVAAASGHLGLAADARSAYERMAALAPALADDETLHEFVRRWYWPEELIERLLEGVARAKGSEGADAPSLASQAGMLSTTTRPLSSGSGVFAAKARRVAVVPFTSRDDDADATALADGLTDDISTGLSRFPHLRVVPASTAATLTTESAGRAGVRYLLEGRVQGGGNNVRVTVRLIDGTTGTNLWADTFDRPLGATAFEVQDDLASYVVATVGDTSGVLARSMAASLLHRPVEELTVRELVLRFHAYVEHFQAEEHARLRSGLERALEREPAVAEGWACLADLYEHEHSQRLNPLPDSLGRQRRAAQRAVEIDPHNQRGWTAMAAVHTFERDRAALRMAAERAIALNPLDADTLGLCALFLSCAGDDNRAMELFARAVRLKPQHPGWYHFPPFTRHYKRREYAEALAEAKCIALPQLPTVHISAAAAAARAGSVQEAQAAVEALRRLDARFLEPESARQAVALWIWDDAHVQDLVDGLAEAVAMRPAGAGPQQSGSADRPRSGPLPAGATAAAPREMRVAVLPFTARGGEDASALAEGLTDDITTALARFPYLQVVTSGAVGARFLLEGAVRSGGSQVRVSVHLSDAQTGAHEWAETFDRDLAPGVFAIQDDIVGRVAATVADGGGVLIRALANHVKSRPIATLDAAELVLRYHGDFAERFDPADHAALRDAFEAVVAREPDGAHGWACLAMLCAVELFFGVNPKPDALARLRHAAERANALDPAIQHGWVAMATAALFGRDRPALEAATDRALALNPFHSRSLATLGLFTVFSGETERGMQLVERALALNPRHPGWYLVAPFLRAYERGEFDQALGFAKRIGMPNFVSGHLAAAAAAGQVGTVDDARPALDALARFDPRLIEPEGARDVWSRWIWSEETIERLVEGLEKALTLTRRAAPPPAAPAASGPR